MKDRARHVSSGEGKALWVAGDLLMLKVVGEDTEGTYAILEEMTPPQGGPPPHIHHREDETLYVLEGEYEVLIGDRTIRVSAGSVVYAPRGVLHTFRNVGTAPGRILAFITPAGLEKFFEEVGEPATNEHSPPPFGQEEIERLLTAAPKHGLEIPPPPEQ